MSVMRRDSGVSIVQVMVAAVLLSGLMLAVVRYISGMNKISRRLESSLVLSGIKVRVMDSVSCAKTLAAQPNCTTSTTYLALKDDADRDVVAFGGTKIGLFTVRARCIPGTSGGIEVRSARLTAAGEANATAKNFGSTTAAWFARDEMNPALVYHWNHPKSDLFVGASGAVGDTRLCREFFSGPPSDAIVTCPSGQVMTGYNTLTEEPVCAAVPPLVTTGNCGSGMVMVGLNQGVPVCRQDETGLGSACTVVTSTGDGRLGAWATCPAGTQVVSGGGRCETASSPVCGDGNQGYLHHSRPSSNLMSWVVDCHIFGAPVSACAQSYALCCPN